MFTGIITDVGKVVGREEAGDIHLTVETNFDLDNVDIGASIAWSGIWQRGAGPFSSPQM